MTGPDDIDMLAAEYVLGTLDAAERSMVARRRSNEPALAAAIAQWERRLAPLDELSPAVEPAPGLLGGIEQAINRSRLRPGPLAAPARDDVVVHLERRLVRWRRTAVAASALAASLALAIGMRETLVPKPSQNFVAVFQKDDAQPAFLMSIDLATRELVIRPVTADRHTDKTYQLWILAEPLGPTPRSLGLLGDASAPTRKTLSSFDPALLQKATFGISVEPPGGSPTDRPTGPALHGKLLPATP